MRLRRFFPVMLLASLAACDSRGGREPHSSGKPGSVDTPRPVGQASDTAVSPPADTVAVAPPDSTTAPPAFQPVVLHAFSGSVTGFGTQAVPFRLATGRAVRLELAQPARRVVFKLYRRTGDLDETVLKEEVKAWTGELEAGEYVAKVFLPLRPANRTRTEKFRFLVLSQP